MIIIVLCTIMLPLPLLAVIITKMTGGRYWIRLCCGIMLTTIGYMLIPVSASFLASRETEFSWEKTCRLRLKFIYRLLSDYKEQYGDLPESFYIMFENGQMQRGNWILFKCPAEGWGKGRHFFYQYVPDSHIQFRGRTPIVWDKGHYHRRLGSGNVLFSDGIVKTLEGEDWAKFSKTIESADLVSRGLVSEEVRKIQRLYQRRPTWMRDGR